MTEPAVAVHAYRDMFGNTCRRFVAPAGTFRQREDSTIAASDRADRVMADAVEGPVADLPDDVVVYQLGSRYCETDRLSQMA